jgi:hypothetical protein
VEAPVGQVFVWAKSPAFVPLTATLPIDNGAVPESVRVTDCAALALPTTCEPNDRLLGDNDTPGAVPVPDKATLWGLSGALSFTCTLALRAPVVEGLNVTEMVQLEPAASVEAPFGQLSVSVKSLTLLPPTPMLLIDRSEVPEFFSVTDCAALVDPTDCEPNDRLPGDNDTAGPGG